MTEPPDKEDKILDKTDKRELQALKEEAVDAAFRNPNNTIIPIDLEEK